jgi:hypothetical protein
VVVELVDRAMVRMVLLQSVHTHLEQQVHQAKTKAAMAVVEVAVAADIRRAARADQLAVAIVVDIRDKLVNH